MMFNGQRKLMNLSRFPALCLVAVLAIGICISTAQTNGPVPQNAPRAAPGNGVRGSNVRPNNSNVPQVPHGPANVGQRPSGTLPNQMQNQPTNFRANYPRSTRQVNPTLAATGVRQPLRTYNVQSGGEVLPRGEIAQNVQPVTDPQRAVKTDDLKPNAGVLAKQGISEGLEAIDRHRIAKNETVDPSARDLADGQLRHHKEELNGQNCKTR